MDGRRVMGFETEYGFDLKRFYSIGELEMHLSSTKLPGYMTENGSRIYNDQAHIEYSSPECRSPLDIVRYDKAGDLICSDFAPLVYKNNVCTNGNTFGFHENYFTCARRSSIDKFLFPFLISRQLFTGSGHAMNDGNFIISPRSRYIIKALGWDTMNTRAIINQKDEKLSDVPDWHRFHLINSDAEMCDIAVALKFGTMDMMLSLLEEERFPIIIYDPNEAVEDFQKVGSITEGWSLGGVLYGSKFALDIQSYYEEECRKAYYGKDKSRNLILDLWREAINGLENMKRNPYALVGSIDWITKKFLLEEFAKREGANLSCWKVRANELEYHRADTGGLFYEAKNIGLIRSLTTDEETLNCAVNPPQNSRAKFRAGCFNYFRKRQRNGNSLCMTWDTCSLQEKSEKDFWKRTLPDPRETYDEYFEEFKEWVNLAESI